MINRSFSDARKFVQSQTEVIKIVTLYRLCSLIITSLFYIIGETGHTLLRRIFFIACISISSIIINYLYIKNQKSKKSIRILLLIETIGNSFILIPSGGLVSPYVWYSMNTILISALLLDKFYCWLSLFIYLLNSTLILKVISNKVSFLSEDIIFETNLVLSFILITGAILILSRYIKSIDKKREVLLNKNNELIALNEKVNSSFNYIMDLYKAINQLALPQQNNGLIDLILNNTKKILKVETVLFIRLVNAKNTMIHYKGSNKDIENNIASNIITIKERVIFSEVPVELNVNDFRYIFIPIQTLNKCFGIIAIDITQRIDVKDIDFIEGIQVIRSLSSLSLENQELERVNKQLLISHEQNRIAGEIHDNVLQRLFSISCGLYETLKKLKNNNNEKIEKELKNIRRSLNIAVKELRATIYGLSWQKSEESSFFDGIKSYINEINELHNISISYSFTGNEELLDLKQKEALYRIICEGIGNSIRHGNSKKIDVDLRIEEEMTYIEIKDNGQGFDTSIIKNEAALGLGLRNIKQLAYLLKGRMRIESAINIGTKLSVNLPNHIQQLYGEEAI